MPDLTTHFLFGEKVLEQASDELSTFLSKYRTEFNYGLQGPDIFFFHKALQGIFSNKNPLRECGCRMHREHIAQTLNFMKKYIASKQNSSDEYEVLRAYFLGFVGHYYLDKYVHPYVYFLVESVQKHHPKLSAHSIHSQYEAQLDAALYKIFYNQRVTTFSVTTHFSLSKRSTLILAKLYSELVYEVYGYTFSVDTMASCFDQLRNTSKLLYDDSGMMYRAVGTIGKAFPKTLNAIGHIKPPTVSSDIANINGRLWHHVHDPSLQSAKSVLTLFEDAKQALLPVLEGYQLDFDESAVTFDTSLNFNGNLNELE